MSEASPRSPTWPTTRPRRSRSLHQCAAWPRRTSNNDRGQPGGGQPVGDPHAAVGDGDGRAAVRHPAGDLRRGPVRQPGDGRQQHGGDGGARQRHRPAQGTTPSRFRAAWPRSRTWPTTRPRPSRSIHERGGLTDATSSSIVVSPAAASQLVIHTQPSSTATAGGRSALSRSSTKRTSTATWRPATTARW